MNIINEAYADESMVQALYNHIEDSGLSCRPTYAEALDAIRATENSTDYPSIDFNEMLANCSN